MPFMEGKGGFHKVITEDDGRSWDRLKSNERDSSGVATSEISVPGDSGRQVSNLCETTVEMCTKIVEPQNEAECLTAEQKLDILVGKKEDDFKVLRIDELHRILNDVHSTSVEKIAAGRIIQKRENVPADNGLY